MEIGTGVHTQHLFSPHSSFRFNVTEKRFDRSFSFQGEEPFRLIFFGCMTWSDLVSLVGEEYWTVLEKDLPNVVRRFARRVAQTAAADDQNRRIS